MTNRFEGSKVVITGAAGIYGSELSRAFAAEGAALCLSDLRGEALDEVARQLAADGCDVVTHATDLTDESSIGDLADRVEKWRGAPDIVVNNAGIYPFGDLMDIDAAHWDRIMDTNLRAPFLVMQRFGALMLAEGRAGCFVNISSGAADIMRLNDVPYCVSKRALEWLSQGFALRLATSGIRVNCVQAGFAPGSAGTAMPKSHARAIVAQSPIPRSACPGDLSEAVMFLASPRASFITGHSLAANGGGAIPHRVLPKGAAAVNRTGVGPTQKQSEAK
jgi:3-oxoacyl-[acyl-carrier protein] reductase